MITGIAVIVSSLLLAVKFLIDSSSSDVALRIGGVLNWIIIPLLILFIVSLTIRIANIIPELPLIF